MPKVHKSTKQVCEFCQFGTEVRVCGRLWHSAQPGLAVTAHHKCMQYSAGLVQYKNEFTDFGNFDPKEVKKEVKRGNKLKCHICKNRHGSATAGCALNICPHSFHFLCAKQDPNRTTLVKKINVYQGEGEGVLDEYVIFCKVSHKHAFDKKRDEAYKYVDSSDDETAIWTRYGYDDEPSFVRSKKGLPSSSSSSSKKRASAYESPRKSKRRSAEKEEHAQNTPSKRRSPPKLDEEIARNLDEELTSDPKLMGENELKIVLKKCNVDKSMSTSSSKDDLSLSQRRPEIETTEDDELSSQKSTCSDTETDKDHEMKSPSAKLLLFGEENKEIKLERKETLYDEVTPSSSSVDPLKPLSKSEVDWGEEKMQHDSSSNLGIDDALSKAPKRPRNSPDELDTQPSKLQKTPSSPVTPHQQKAKEYRRHPFFAQTDGHMDPKSPLSSPLSSPSSSRNLLAPLKQVVFKVWQSMQSDTSPGKTSASPAKPTPPGLKNADPVPFGSRASPQPLPDPQPFSPPPLSDTMQTAGHQRVIGTLRATDDQHAEAGCDPDCLEPCIKEEPDSDSSPVPTSAKTLTREPAEDQTLVPVLKMEVDDSQSSQLTQTIKKEPDEVLKKEISVGNNGFSTTASISHRPKESSSSVSPVAPPSTASLPNSITLSPLSSSSVQSVSSSQPSQAAQPLRHSHIPMSTPKLVCSNPKAAVPRSHAPVSSKDWGVSPAKHQSAVVPVLSSAPVPPVAPVGPVVSLAPQPDLGPKLDIQQPNIIDPSDIRIASITPVSKSPPQRSNPPMLEVQNHSPPGTVSFSPKPSAGKITNGVPGHPKLFHGATQVTKAMEVHGSRSPLKPPVNVLSAPSSYAYPTEQKKSELTERLHGIMSKSPCKDAAQAPMKKVMPNHVPSHVPNSQTSANSPVKPHLRHASTRSDVVLCMMNMNRIDQGNLDFIYSSALSMFGVKRHQVLMKYMPGVQKANDTNSKKVKFDGLLHLKELAESLSNKDLESVQKLALDKNMQVYSEKHKTFSFDMYPTLLDIVEAILEEADLKYNHSIAKLLRLEHSDIAVAFMLHLNHKTDPGFKVRAVYNNIFIWNPSTQVNFEQELCDPEREYATIQSWLDKQTTQGICPYYKPSDSILLRPGDQSVLKRLKEKVLEQTYDQPPPAEHARKVYFIGPMDESVIPQASAYLKKCIPRITEQLEMKCSLVLCVIAIDRSIRSIKDVCAPLPGFDMNILTVFDPLEFCPSCFVLKIARRKKNV